MKHRLHSKFASVLTTVTMLLAIVGFPLPQSEPKGDADFPCRDHGCGCTTALMCRTACCCVKPAKKPLANKSLGGCCSAKKDTPAKKTGWAIGATGCQGLSASWSGLGLLVPPAHEKLLSGLTHVVYALPSDQILPPPLAPHVDTPPPRLHFS